MRALALEGVPGPSPAGPPLGNQGTLPCPHPPQPWHPLRPPSTLLKRQEESFLKGGNRISISGVMVVVWCVCVGG